MIYMKTSFPDILKMTKIDGNQQ